MQPKLSTDTSPNRLTMAVIVTINPKAAMRSLSIDPS